MENDTECKLRNNGITGKYEKRNWNDRRRNSIFILISIFDSMKFYAKNNSLIESMVKRKTSQHEKFSTRISTRALRHLFTTLQLFMLRRQETIIISFHIIRSVLLKPNNQTNQQIHSTRSPSNEPFPRFFHRTAINWFSHNRKKNY